MVDYNMIMKSSMPSSLRWLCKYRND